MQDAHQPNLQRVIPYIVRIGIVGTFMLIPMHQGYSRQILSEAAIYSVLSTSFGTQNL